jgi:hypothetical protein
MSFQVEDHYHVIIGSNTFIDNEHLITYKGEPLLTLKRHENGYLGIYLDLYNKNGQKIASVKRNELYFDKKTDKTSYEQTGSASRYTLTDKRTGETVIDIKKREEAKPAELEISINLYTPDGFLIQATPTSTNLGGNKIINCTFQGNFTAIAIE